MASAVAAAKAWRAVPAPKRGEAVRLMGEELRKHKSALGSLVSLEMGKIKAEGDGEVQEMIDIADFAVGQSRMLYGLQMHSERPNHRMFEQWHPLGVVGVISAFNFPGRRVVVERVPRRDLRQRDRVEAVAQDGAVRRRRAARLQPRARAPRLPADLPAVHRRRRRARGQVRRGPSRRPRLVHGLDGRRPRRRAARREAARQVACSSSAATTRSSSTSTRTSTSSCRRSCSARSARPASAARRRGACSCTSRAWPNSSGGSSRRTGRCAIGDPLAQGTLMGPLIDAQLGRRGSKRPWRRRSRTAAGCSAAASGSTGPATSSSPPSSWRAASGRSSARRPSGRSSTSSRSRRSTRRSRRRTRSRTGFRRRSSPTACSTPSGSCRPAGSDCGIANVNIGTSGAEIGGAFGGEKDTGGGRESGSDSWKAYMRRQTCTVNWGADLPLAQGINFDLSA